MCIQHRDVHAPLYATALSLAVLMLRVLPCTFTGWQTLRRVELCGFYVCHSAPSV
ncbi:hypothetical protein K438DRAFT_1844458 [Mycena galopus ATCC 62051]|nr:hypothetical protein K438DRAFT_1844458 [Mycena galopus ATCC 62051]